MRQKFFTIFASILIIVTLLGRYSYNQKIKRYGVRILVPITVESFENDGYSSYAKIRYHAMIPAAKITHEGGQIIVSKDLDDTVSYVDVYDASRALRPREHLLKYKVAYSFKALPEVRFGAATIRIRNKIETQTNNIKYAVLRVNKSGSTILIGLADRNGIRVVKN